MARPIKKGLDYYTKDTGYYDDYKIIDLLDKYGPLGQTIYDVILTLIYRNGYYYSGPKDTLALLVVRIIGNKWIKDRNFVGQVIDYCADIGLFDKDLLQQNTITSVGIQRRYDFATVRNKVDKTKYWLLENKENEEADISASENPITETETPITETETPITETEMQQMKLNDIKLNNIKDSNLPSADESAPGNNSLLPSEEVKPFICLPLNDKSLHKVMPADVEHYKELYPAVNVELELKGMLGWLESNPRKRKTKSGIKSFITRWLSKTQNRGGALYGQNQPAPTGQAQQFFTSKQVY